MSFKDDNYYKLISNLLKTKMDNWHKIWHNMFLIKSRGALKRKSFKSKRVKWGSKVCIISKFNPTWVFCFEVFMEKSMVPLGYVKS